VENFKWPSPVPARNRFQLLAGIRRRAVDAGTSIVFLLSVFLVVQFFLSQEVTGKDKALEQLNAKLAQLNELCHWKTRKLNLDDQLSQVRAGLASAEAERDRVKSLYEGLAGAGNDAADAPPNSTRRWIRRVISSRALAQIEVLTNRSARCAASSPRSKRRSTPRKSATRNRRVGSPISASG